MTAFVRRVVCPYILHSSQALVRPFYTASQLVLTAWLLCLGSAGLCASAQQVLQGHVRAQVSTHQAALVDRLPSGQQLQLSIILPLRNQADLSSLLQRLYDPSSPDFHKFLSVSQFTEQFGPAKDDYNAVIAFARANGFTVTHDPANRLVVPVSGTADQVNKAFHVQMNVYQHPTETRTFYSPDREPSVDLSVPIAYIDGMDNYSLPQHFAVRPPQGAAQPMLTTTGSGPGGSYLGSDMRAAYYGGSTLTGLNQSIGLLEFGGYLLSDVNLTFSNAGQTYGVPINNVLLDGMTGAPSGSDGEEVLDIVQAIGMAPGVSQVRVYIGSNPTDILNSMASENIAKQLSCSWGWRPASLTAADVFFQEMAAQGQSFFTASGDAGAYDAAINPYFFPAEDGYVTAVGGTHMTTNGAGGAWTSETVWNSSGDGSGGGISPDNIAIPSWQSGVANSANGGSTTIRNVPDVAMEGDFDNYACASGACNTDYAGTSFAAPRWAGFMALVNQQAVEAGNAPNGGIGFINPSLYLLGEGASTSSDFHDIVSGNNDTENQPLYWNATVGYDLTTGWGSPAGQKLIDALAGPQVPGFFLAASQSAVPVNPGGTGSVTLQVTDAGGFTGSINFAVTSSLPSGVTATFSPNPTTGNSVLTLTASSSAATADTSVTVTGTSGNVSATTTFTLSVHPPAFALTASPSALGITQGASGTSTITVVPQYGFTGAVSLVASGLPSGVTATFSPASTTGSSTLTFAVSSTATAGTSTVTISGGSGSLSATTTIALTVHGPSFTVSTGANASVGQGSTTTAYVYVTDLYGFTGNVTLAATGLPTGVTASFSPNPASGSSTMTLTAASTAAVGQSTITVTGTSGSLTASTTFTLGVYAPTFTLYGSSSISVGQGSSGTGYVDVSPQYGFTGNVNLTVSGLPSGVTAYWSPNPTTSNSTLTLVATTAAKAGQYTLIVTGTSGTQSATTTITLGVYAPTFTLSSSSSVTLGQGTSSTAYVYVTPQYGFTGSVTLSVSGLPSGVTGTFSPNPTTGTSTLTLTATSTAVLGQYTATITGTSGTQTASTTLSVGVYTPTFTLSGYGSINVGRGSSSTGYIYINQQYGFTGSVTLSASGLPSGVTASFSPNPGTTSSTLTLAASSTAALGQYTITITGISGTQTASTKVTVGVYTPTFSLYGSSALSVGQGATTSTYVSISPQYGFTGSVSFAVSGLPSGVTASFSPNPSTSSTTLALTASSAAATGQYSLVVTGTSGTQSATLPITLGVYTPTFTLSGYGVSVGQGSTASSYVYVNPQYGFAGSVALSVTGLPSGVTAAFSPNPTTGSSLLTLTASSSAALGSSTLTITGTSGSQTATTTLTLGVYAPTFTLSSSLYSVSLNEGASTTGYVYIYDQYGFTGGVALTTSGLPSGVTATFSPNPATSTSSAVTLAVSSSAVPGTYPVVITGTSGTQTASTTFQLTINAPGFTLAAAPSKLSLLPGTSSKATVSLTPVNGFAGSVALTATGLPAGVTAAFSPASTTSTSMLTLTAGSSAVAGVTAISITGTSGSITASAPLTVTLLGSQVPATTSLVLTAGGSVVSSITAGTSVTATAAITSGSTPITAGQVNFCDASAPTCDALHIVGSAQITNAGTAVLHFIPGPGSRMYKAVFTETKTNTSSTSAVASLTVNASLASTTTVTQSGSAGNYTLTSTVTGQGPFAPSGKLSFLDTSNGNAVLGQAALVSGTPAYSAVNAQTATVGSSPEYSVTGDFNGDGIPDLAVVNYASSNVSILLGKGDGTFTAGTALQTSSYSSLVTVGDFNHDGKADLAVLSSGSPGLAVYLGNGDGTFSAGIVNPTLTYAYSVAMVTGDFNGDGLLDLAIANQSSNAVNILLGNGDGTFSTAPSLTAGYSVKSMVAADFNGDGVADLAVLNTSAAMVLFLGNGDGTFSSVPAITAGSSPVSLVAADFNRDGKQDLLVGNEYATATTLLLGNGDGTFTSGTGPGLSSYPLSLAAADLNADGNVDVIATNYYGSAISMALGNGDGTFAAASTYTTGVYPYALVIGDWNGDGISDIAVPNYGAGTVTVLTSALAQKSTASATAIAPLGTGQHAVQASYPGDVSYHSSLSASTSLTATAGPPTVTVSPSAPGITTQQTLPVTITVSGGSGNPTPSGTVVLTSGSYTSSAVTLSSGSGSITVPAGSLPSGSDTLTATYTPDAASTGAYLTAKGTTTVTVAKVTPAILLSLPGSSIATGQALAVTIAVNSGVAGAVPTGSVLVASGTYTSPATALTGGSAVVTVPAGSLAVGNATLTVSYTPDSAGSTTYNQAMGSSSITVTQQPVSLSVSTLNAITAGSSGTATVTLTANSTYAGTLSLSCTLLSTPSAAQSLPTCGLAANSLPLTAGKSASTVLTISTTAAHAALQYPSGFGPRGYLYGGPVMALALFLLLPSRRRRLSVLVVLLFAFAAAAGLSGCAGSGSQSSGSGSIVNSTPATTPGVYTFNVTATDSTSSTSTSSSVSVTIQ